MSVIVLSATAVAEQASHWEAAIAKFGRENAVDVVIAGRVISSVRPEVKSAQNIHAVDTFELAKSCGHEFHFAPIARVFNA